jgi:TatD DNase family protein
MRHHSTAPLSIASSPGAQTREDSQPPQGSHPALVDIGINLTHDSYDPDRAAVLSRAHAAGVVQMIVTGASAEGSRHALQLAHSAPGRLFATAGVHPHHAAVLGEASREELTRLAREPAVVAVGECGLDYFRDFSPRPVQREAFAWQLALAAQAGKPVFLHERDAHADFLAILREHWPGLTAGAVAHCFTGDGAQLAAYLELGLMIGITGWICDERRGSHLASLMSLIPAGRLLVETDGPYLLPRDLSPKPASRRNEPAYLPHIVSHIARARQESYEALAAHSTAAARRLFRLPSLPPASPPP